VIEDVHFTIDFDRPFPSTSIKACGNKPQEPTLDIQSPSKSLYPNRTGSEPVSVVEDQPGEFQSSPKEYSFPTYPTDFFGRSTSSNGTGNDRFHPATYDRHYQVNLTSMISTVTRSGIRVAALHVTTSLYRTKVFLACCKNQNVVVAEIRFYKDFSVKWDTISRFWSTSQTLLEQKTGSSSSLDSGIEETVLGDETAPPCEIWALGNVCCNSSASSQVLLTEANAAIRQSLNLDIA
jgi:hypothetical protein